MKVYIHTTLLILLGCFIFPEVAQSQETRKELRTDAQIASKQGGVMTHDVSFDKEVVEELDSLLRNGVGLTRVTKGNKSVLKMELDPSSKASLNMFGCIDLGYRASDTGKARPDARIAGIKTNRKRMTPAEKKEPAILAISTPPAEKPAEKAEAPATVTPRTSSQLETSLTAPTTSTHTEYRDNTQKLFRTMNISVVDNADRSFLKKYSVVLGTFRSQNNADFIRRTFNGMGERVIIVRSTTGVYYALLASYATQEEAVKKFDDFSKKYTDGISRAKRISKYGIPLDDMWILIKD